MTTLERLDAFRAAGVLADLDVHFARFVVRLAGVDDDALALGGALLSRRVGAGHACLDLAEVAGRVALPALDDDPVGVEPLRAPSLGDWRTALRASGVVGEPGEDRPLVLDAQGRLYLHRYWCYERDLADDLRVRAAADAPVDEARLRADLARLFPEAAASGPDWQRIAAATAVLRRLCIISGGPGTGKTTTVVRILALLLGQDDGIRIALAAPTGKAAARMREAIRAAKRRLGLSDAETERIPEEATTIHRLLGARPGSARFHHDRKRPLAVDALVVDEASMVDLALMAKVVAALPPTARLVLLGDRDQLASVEPGAVLGELCSRVGGFSEPFRRRVEAVTGDAIPPGTAADAPLRDAVVLLSEQHRFARGSAIGELASAVNRGDVAGVRAWLDRATTGEVVWRRAGSPEAIARAAADGYRAYLDALRAGAPANDLFAAFRRFRVLCAHRRGPWGVEHVNRAIEAELCRRGLLDPGTWTPGRPVLVTQNDYALGLFNGDVGLVLAEGADTEHVRVAFETDGAGVRRLAPSRLPAHEPVWAMTVHKSQGSEFDRVLLVLPAEPSALVTRELLYTGITRARAAVEICGEAAVIAAGVETRMMRSSGLRDALGTC